MNRLVRKKRILSLEIAYKVRGDAPPVANTAFTSSANWLYRAAYHTILTRRVNITKPKRQMIYHCLYVVSRDLRRVSNRATIRRLYKPVNLVVLCFVVAMPTYKKSVAALCVHLTVSSIMTAAKHFFPILQYWLALAILLN